MDLRPSYTRNTGQHKITYIPLFKKIFDFKGLTMFIYTENHAEFEFFNDSIELYGKNDVYIDIYSILCKNQ